MLQINKSNKTNKPKIDQNRRTLWYMMLTIKWLHEKQKYHLLLSIDLLVFELDANRADGARVEDCQCTWVPILQCARDPMCPSSNIPMRQSSNVPIMCQSARRDRSTCQRLWDNCGGGRFLEARASILVNVCLYCVYILFYINHRPTFSDFWNSLCAHCEARTKFVSVASSEIEVFWKHLLLGIVH